MRGVEDQTTICVSLIREGKSEIMQLRNTWTAVHDGYGLSIPLLRSLQLLGQVLKSNLAASYTDYKLEPKKIAATTYNLDTDGGHRGFS